MTETETKPSWAHLTALSYQCKKLIEKIVEPRNALYGYTALTPRHTPYVVICNGALKYEGDKRAPLGNPQDLVEASVAIAQSFRDNINGEAYLVWRIPPEFDERGNLYMRLCFESIPE